ncbi:MAG: hypothetical protein U0521_27035 [Anaerolineae bacterium]
MSSSRGQDFYNRQIKYLEANDVPGLIANQYADDGVIVGFGFTRKGTAALLEHFKNYMAQLGKIKLLSTDKFTETDDAIFFEATVETAGGTAQVYDVFIINPQGKASHHFTGLKSFTPFGSAGAAFSEAAIREMGVRWYGSLDSHEPEIDMLKFLVPEGLEQQWPDYHVQSLVDFEGWYQRALGLFFDELHTIKEFNVTISPDGSKADVKVFVNWKARVWTPREAKSKFLNLDIHQTWVLVPEAGTGKPLIKFIRVDDATPLEGSDSL